MKAHPLLAGIKKNYHWIIAGAAFLEVFICFGFTNNLFSLYLIPVTEDLHISRSAFSIAFSIQNAVLVISNLMFASLYSRFGFRITSSVSLFITALTCVGLARIHGMTFLIILLIAQGLASPFCGSPAISSFIANWFQRYRGTVLGIVMAASGIGSSMISIITSNVMSAYNWRAAMLVSGALLALTALAIALLSKDTPSKMGLKPLGEGQDFAPPRKKHARQVENWKGFSLVFLKKRYYFYLFFAAFAMSCSINLGVSPVIVAHLQDCGMSASQAASIQSIRYLALFLAKIVEGILCDKFGSRSVLVASVLCAICGTAMIAPCTSFGMALAGSLVMTAGMSINTIVISILIMDTFGYANYSALLGIANAMYAFSAIIITPAVNVVYDRMGSYYPAFIAIIVILCLSIVLYLLAFRGSDRDRLKA